MAVLGLGLRMPGFVAQVSVFSGKYASIFTGEIWGWPRKYPELGDRRQLSS